MRNEGREAIGMRLRVGNRVAVIVTLLTLATACGEVPAPIDSRAATRRTPVKAALQSCQYFERSNQLETTVLFQVTGAAALDGFRGSLDDFRFLAFSGLRARVGRSDRDVFGSYQYNERSKERAVKLVATVPGRRIPLHLTVEHLQLLMPTVVALSAPSPAALEGQALRFPFGTGQVLNVGDEGDRFTIDVKLTPGRISSAFLNLGAREATLAIGGHVVEGRATQVTPTGSDLIQRFSFEALQEKKGDTRLVLSGWVIWTVPPVVLEGLASKCVSRPS